MSSDELNQTTRRDFLARVAKTGALVAPVIATFAMTSNSPVNARGAFPAGPVPGPGNGGGGNGGGGELPDLPDFNYQLPKVQSDLPDTK